MNEHTFQFDNDTDFIVQMTAEINRRQKGQMEPYAVVRSRYPHIRSAATFSMRLKRFRDWYPKQLGPGGVRIQMLFVTEALHEHLKAVGPRDRD